MPNSTPDECLAAPTPAPNSRPTDLKRRRFLFTLGVGGAGAAVAVASTLPGTSDAHVATASPADEDSSYRETEHVRDYYRTAKI